MGLIFVLTLNIELIIVDIVTDANLSGFNRLDGHESDQSEYGDALAQPSAVQNGGLNVYTGEKLSPIHLPPTPQRVI